MILGQGSLFDPDSLEGPYVRRQTSMRGILDAAMSLDHGIVYAPAPTGSGKTYVAARACATELILHEARVPGHDAHHVGGIVFVVPQKENRDAFVNQVKILLHIVNKELGFPLEPDRVSALYRDRVLRLCSNEDVAFYWFYEPIKKKGHI